MLYLVYRSVLLAVMRSTILVGGQAVIEGVMMRVPGAYATAVRKSDGNIIFDYHKFQSKVLESKIYSLPILRGMVHLYESMKIGYQTLQWSAEVSDPHHKTNQILDTFLSFFSIIFSIGLFVGIPIFAADFLQSYFFLTKNTVTFNLISGLVRISIFLIYLISISFMKDIKRLFQFHGAEHQTVYNFESGEPLLTSHAKNFPKEHPRCGTSFLFIVMLVSIFSYSIIDFFAIKMGFNLTIINRLLIHIPCLPIVAGFSYEVLKITAKFQKHLFFRILAFPGILLQKITTKTPNNEQLEVAIDALKHAFGDDLTKYEGKQFDADAIG